MRTIDLRSDTVTRPSHAMRMAMANAEVGDDVYGEDPSINRLQVLAAELLGKEAALFVPSGTMANQIALRSLTSPGDLLLAGQDAHILRYESGAASALWGVQIQTIGGGGLFDADQLESAIPFRDVHHAPATAVALENTHNVSGGRVWPLGPLDSVTGRARERDLRVHLDGARIFNAAAAIGTSVRRIADACDTVSFCLSKGLGAPVGSLVCGDADRVRSMHRTRKMLGGGMRQAGILAAAGIHALEHNVERLPEDHANATRLAKGLTELGLDVDSLPETNIVIFSVPPGRSGPIDDAPKLSRAALTQNLLVNPIDRERLRAVTHLDVSADDISDALQRFSQLLS